MNYKLGEHIIRKDGKLVIANDKKRLIKLAVNEIQEWIDVREKAKSEIVLWEMFIEDINKKTCN